MPGPRPLLFLDVDGANDVVAPRLGLRSFAWADDELTDTDPRGWRRTTEVTPCCTGPTPGRG